MRRFKLGHYAEAGEALSLEQLDRKVRKALVDAESRTNKAADELDKALLAIHFKEMYSTPQKRPWWKFW